MQQAAPRVKPGGGAHRASRAGVALDVACLAILAFVIRCLNYGGVFAGTDVVFYGIDPYGHMRRIALAVEQFPRVPTFDYFLNFPNGADIPWPVGFDFLLAAAGWIAGGFGTPARSVLEALCAWSIPVLGALCVLLVYGVGRRFFGRAVAVMAAALLAIVNAHVSISQIGRVDHHVMETLIVPLIFLLFVSALRATHPSEARRKAIGAGIVTGASFLFWAGSTVFAALPGLFVIVSFMLPGRRVSGPRSARLGAVLYASGAIVVLLGGLTSPFFRQMAFTPLALSWFHLFAMSLGAAVCALLAGPGEGSEAGRWRLFTGAAVLGTAVIAGLAALSPQGIGGLGKALLYLAARDPLAGATLEARSLLEVGTAGLSWAFTRLWVLAPAALLYVIVRALRGRFGDPALTFLLLWFLAAVLLAGGQFVRYQHHLAPPLALILALGVAAAWRWAKHRSEGAGRPAAIALLVGTIAVPLWLIHDRVIALRPTSVQNSVVEFPPARDAFLWLKYNSADPGGLHNPRERPDYGVLAPWGFGFWLNYIGERPNVASPNLLLPAEIDGALRSFEVLLADDEESAAEQAEAMGARYIVVAHMYASLPSFMAAVGRSAAHLMASKGEGRNRTYRFKDPYFRILSNRMFLFDGSASHRFGVEGLGRFRLVYESPQRFRWSRIPQDPVVTLEADETSAVKIFERVPGAMLAGSTTPLTPVLAEVAVQTNQGRKFDFRISTRSDAQGAFELRLPYATESGAPAGRTAALGPYRVSSGGGQAQLFVSEEEVRAGARLGASALRGGGVLSAEPL